MAGPDLDGVAAVGPAGVAGLGLGVAALLDACLEAFVGLDGAGRVLAWNRAAEGVFGYSAGQACGRLVEELVIPERFRGAHRAGLARVAAGGAGTVLGRRLLLPARHADGHEFDVELTLNAVDTPVGRRFFAFAHDVSDRVRAEWELTRERGFLHAVLDSIDVGVLAGHTGEDRALANRALRALDDAAPDSAGWAEWTRRLELLDTDRRPIPAGQGPMARAFAGERVRDVEVLLATPGRSARAFSVNGQPILDEGGQRLGAVVALHEVTGRRLAERFTRAELAVSRALATAATAHDAGRAVCEAVAATLAWPHAELWLTDETSQMLKLAASWSAPGRDLRPFRIDTLPRGAGVPGAVWESGQPLWVPDLATDTRFIRARAAAQTGLHVALGAPVRSGNRILGVLAVFGDTVEDPSDALTGLLGGLAAHIGQYLERRRAEELAVALARATDELVALVTHELRSPLAAITTYAEILADETADRLDEGQRRDLDTIRRNAARLSTLINDLLDLARLESGDVSIDLHPLDLCALIREAAETVQTAARAKGLTLSLDLPPHAVVHGDADRLRQVADNMLSNAVKYTPDGGQVSVSVTADDPVEWAVTDTGIGIPPAERHRLFGRFYRASNAQTQRIPGTGLGLAITRTILQRHHGTITLGDHHGPGTTFLITLPVHPRLSPTHTTHPDTATRTGHP